jgi:hypothetical protein
LLLLKKGWTLVAIAEVLSSWNNQELERQILVARDGENVDVDNLSSSQESSSFFQQRTRNNTTLAEDAVILLAQGILRQYDRVLTGREIVRQDDKLPPELHSAMCKLGRLYLEEGKCDRARRSSDINSFTDFSYCITVS